MSDPYRTQSEPQQKYNDAPSLEAIGLTDDCSWYLAAARGQKAGPRMVALIREMSKRQTTLISNTERCISAFQWGGSGIDLDPQDHAPIDEESLVFNAAQNAVETVHSKVIKARISPMPLTTGGGYLARHRAKQMGKAIEGVLDENHCDEAEEEIVMDALVTDHGAGAAIVVEKDDCVRIRDIAVEDVWFDEAETRQKDPRCCYYVPKDGVDLYVALEEWARPDDEYPGLVGTPETRRRAILNASSTKNDWRVRSSTESSQKRVEYYESWHLPSGKVEEYDEEYDDEESGEKKTRKAYRHDGRHVVAVEGEDGTLIDEPWDGDDGQFPILLYVPRRRRRSVWGLSLMRSLLAPQLEYEKGTKKIQNTHQKMGVSGWSASREANLNQREITAGTYGAGFVMEFDGQSEPRQLVTSPVAPDVYAYVGGIPRDMLERNGISTLAATSQLPAGMQQASGKALQVFEDFESERLLPYHRERERWKMKLSWLIVNAARRIVERKGSYKAQYRGKKGLETIDWKDVLMDRDSFVLKVFPVSQLAKQPAAKFAQLTELLNAGAITVEQFKRLFELPDLEAENELDTSDTDVIDRAMDIMVTTGRYLSPEPFDNLELIVQRAGKFYNLCRQQEVPDARLKLLRDYIEDTKSLIEQAKAKAAALAMAAAPPMPPAGPPGMVPPAGPLPGMPPAPAGAPPMPMPMAA